MTASALRDEKFCSSCFKYRPAEDVKLVISANGKQRLLRCNICTDNRKKAKEAAKAAAAAPAAPAQLASKAS